MMKWDQLALLLGFLYLGHVSDAFDEMEDGHDGAEKYAHWI